MPYLKVKLVKGVVNLDGSRSKRTIYMRVQAVPEPGQSILGFEIDPKTTDDKSKLVNGVVHETKTLLHKSCIESVTRLYDDLYYGGLTTATPQEQIKKMGREA